MNNALQQFILMSPYYVFGIFLIYAVYISKYKELLTVKIKPIAKFFIFMFFVTAIRVILFYFTMDGNEKSSMSSSLDMIHWQTLLMVFWEDMAHGVPLAIAYLNLKDSKYFKYIYYPLLFMVMVSFGAGHTYQGMIAACLLSFYIPFSVKAGLKHGFGTVMICHIVYDLITYFTFRLIVSYV